MSDTDTDSSAWSSLFERERQRFLSAHPRSLALSQAARPHFLFGLPMHWMRDWPTPVTLYVQQAQGARLTCADGHVYSDFCLGDTGAMFGHSPPALTQALQEWARQGLSCMLPGDGLPELGRTLSECFGLSVWQMALSASDANRFVLRWARAVTQRPMVLVFDGCYHGAVDDTLVDRDPVSGATLARPSVLGSVHAHQAFTRVIPFNDLAALEAALADRQVAVLLAEPALTNCGLVPPIPGFWEQAQTLCRQHGTLLVLDETHTISSGPGGHARQHGLSPDGLVLGKAVAGGLPCALYGWTPAVAERIETVKAQAPEGHSGIGTTLSANLLSQRVLQATLSQWHSSTHYHAMLEGADRLTAGLRQRIAQAGRPWTVTQLGARLELQYCPTTPLNAEEVRRSAQPTLEALTHLYLLNRGVLLTPFHHMMLCAPSTDRSDIQRVLDAFDALLSEAPDGHPDPH